MRRGVDICWSNARSKFHLCQRGSKLQIGWLAERENRGLGAYRMPKTEPSSLDVMATFSPGVCESIPGLRWCNIHQLLGSEALCSTLPNDNNPASAMNSHSALIKSAWPACHAKLIRNYFLRKLKLTPHVPVMQGHRTDCTVDNSLAAWTFSQRPSYRNILAVQLYIVTRRKNVTTCIVETCDRYARWNPAFYLLCMW